MMILGSFVYSEEELAKHSPRLEFILINSSFYLVPVFYIPCIIQFFLKINFREAVYISTASSIVFLLIEFFSERKKKVGGKTTE
jgi:hypothetical protein